MLAAAMTAATTTGAGVKGSMRRHDITAWNSAAQAPTCYSVTFYIDRLAHACKHALLSC